MPRFDIIPTSSQPLTSRPSAVPALFADAGGRAWEKCVEFFTAHIRNPHTRRAYAQAVRQFCAWCDARHLALRQLTPFLVAAYVEELGARLSKPSGKPHLAAIRMSSTTSLTAEECGHLINSFEAGTPAGLRDRALIATTVYSFARVGMVLGVDTDDFDLQGRR